MTTPSLLQQLLLNFEDAFGSLKFIAAQQQLRKVSGSFDEYQYWMDKARQTCCFPALSLPSHLELIARLVALGVLEYRISSRRSPEWEHYIMRSIDRFARAGVR